MRDSATDQLSTPPVKLPPAAFALTPFLDIAMIHSSTTAEHPDPVIRVAEQFGRAIARGDFMAAAVEPAGEAGVTWLDRTRTGRRSSAVNKNRDEK